jgi:alkanesulfonate monooxygenase SsuD/methylene tetrahydromethanopterin reductase-like flavin-dependent oxidoreductase (luciferase family)
MLRIGVRLPGRFEDSGEYLADARALDAAGADSIWLYDEGSDPWLLMGGIAAVTGRTRLVAPVSAADLPARARLSTRIETLGRLSRGRAALRVATSGPGAADDARALLEAIRASRSAPAIVELSSLADARAVASLADGLVAVDGPPDARRAASESILRSRREAGVTTPFEVWVRLDTPEDREGWKRALLDAEAAGATGVLVPAGPRLLDILRNPDEDEDRSDLHLAQG